MKTSLHCSYLSYLTRDEWKLGAQVSIWKLLLSVDNSEGLPSCSFPAVDTLP